MIENLHTKILAAVTADPQLFGMRFWHRKTACGTSHCRAGWVVELAGEEGKKLEAETSTSFAAMQIYAASSPIKVSPARFYDENAEALADIRRCAAEETDGKTPQP